jgi:uridine phosphorylase
VPGFEPRFKDLPGSLAKVNVINFEMEISALFTLASVGGFRAGAVCAVFAQRHHNKFVDAKTKSRAELDCVQAGLKAFEVLAHMDAWKAQNAKPYWHV